MLLVIEVLARPHLEVGLTLRLGIATVKGLVESGTLERLGHVKALA
jgi:hypothetical protein